MCGYEAEERHTQEFEAKDAREVPLIRLKIKKRLNVKVPHLKDKIYNNSNGESFAEDAGLQPQ